MTKHTHSELPVYAGWITIAVGLFPVARGLRLFPEWLPVHASDAPDWVILLCGIVFIIAGLMIITKNAHDGWQHFFAAMLTGSMGLMGVWVSLLSPDEGMAGGLPFLAREHNILIARAVFGAGALFSAGLFSYAIKQLFRHKARR